MDTDVLLRINHPRFAASLIPGAVLGGRLRLLIVRYVVREFCRVLSRKFDPIANIALLNGLVMSGVVLGHVHSPPWEPRNEEVVESLSALPSEAKTDVPILLTARKFRPDVILTYNMKHWGKQDEFPAMTPEQFFAKT